MIMILKSISLRNIRSYTEQYISFPKGSTLLAGDIGSGKSSILQAVEFALFGARRDSISGDALLRKGADDGEVELKLSIDDKEVTIKRRLKRQQRSISQEAGFISINGSKTEGTATELKARIISLLNYPKDLLNKSNSLVYRYTVYTPQEEMKQIIMEAEEHRIDTLRKVFGIDRYKRIAANATAYVRQIKEGKKELQGMMQGIDEKKTELRKRKEELETVNGKKKDILPAVEEIREKKASSRKGLEEKELAVKQLNELKNRSQVCDARLMEIVKNRSKNNSELEETEQAITILKRKLESIFLEEKMFPPITEVEKDIADREKRMNELSTRNTQLKERQKQIQERITDLKRDIETKDGRARLSKEKEALYHELLEKLKDKELITKSLQEMDTRLKANQKIMAELSAKKKHSQDIKEKITSLDTCPTCRQDVTEVHKRSIAEEEDHRIEKADAELDQMNKDRQDIESRLRQHNQKLETLTETERRLAAVKVEVDNLKTITTELENARKLHADLDQEKLKLMQDLEKLDDRMIQQMTAELEKKRSLLKEINEYNLKLKEKKHNLASMAEKEQRKEQLTKMQEQLKEEVKQINNDKLTLNEQITRSSDVEKEYQLRKEALEKITDDEKHLEIRLSEFNKELESLDRFMISIQKDITQKEKAGKTLEQLNSVQEWLEKMFINLMGVMERQIMAKVHSQFSELFATWLNTLIEDESISVRIDDSFAPIVTQNGYDTDLTHLSGGEKTSVALAYRLALNKVINDLMTNIHTRNLIMLDEPTDGFSSEQLDKVREVLDQLNMKQTIIVSHEPKIESFVENVIRVHKTDHVSRVVS
ncbi:AAA family ATPase [Nanoarchaeota archaeon]